MKNKELEVQKYKKNYECIKYLPFWSFFIPKLAPSVTNNLNRKNYQKQPFRGALTKSVLKICSKFTGEHPC